MKTYPMLEEGGTIRSFEISSGWLSAAPIMRLLEAVPGVVDVRRDRSTANDYWVTFSYNGVPCAVEEPWGDNSRLWIGPVDSASRRTDMKPIHDQFLAYRRPLAELAAWGNRRSTSNKGWSRP
jgi:hypothetical protein